MADKKLDPKQIWQSMTVWFNTILFLLPDLVWLLDELLKQEIVTIPAQVNLLMKVVAILNILLRLKTRQAIEMPKP